MENTNKTTMTKTSDEILAEALNPNVNTPLTIEDQEPIADSFKEPEIEVTPDPIPEPTLDPVPVPAPTPAQTPKVEKKSPSGDKKRIVGKFA